MELYQLDKLMEETRALAAKYRAATGQALPVSHDLACYDAIRLLNLKSPENAEASVDAWGLGELEGKKFQIKSRVMFTNLKSKQQRIGQLNLDGHWDVCLVVLLNDDYDSEVILAAEKSTIKETLGDKKVNKRGAMTVAQFRAIAEPIWSQERIEDGADGSKESGKESGKENTAIDTTNDRTDDRTDENNTENQPS